MSNTRPSTARRRRAWRFGRRAELFAVGLLRLKGYRILARDFRLPVGEIDIVAQRGSVVAFVEVKGRGHASIDEVLTRRQRRRIERAAEGFLARHPALARLDARFDLMLVGGWRLPRHLAGIWRLRE